MLFSMKLFAQVEVNKSQLQFGDVTTGSFKKLSITVDNKESVTVDVDLSIIFPGFWVSPVNLSIPAGQKGYADVVFEPEQNIKYNAELILKTDSRLGDVRVDLLGSGRHPEQYYSSTFDLFEEELKDELKSIVSANYKNLGYYGARDRMYASIDNVGGTVTCVYTGKTANFTTRSGANSVGFNCEHTWPQSLFSSREPERADIHHLFPTDGTANSQRSNLPFGNVTSSTWSVGGSKRGNGVFEVRPEHKGNTARAMFYFAIRYGNLGNFLGQQENNLRTWSENDLPDTDERDRNDAIEAVQNNRNPFVDHPEFLERIHSLSSTSVEPENPQLDISGKVDLSELTLWNQISDVHRVYVTNNGNRKFTLDKYFSENESIKIETDSPRVCLPGESIQIRVRPVDFNATIQVADTMTLEFQSENTSTNERVIFQVPVTMNLQAVLGIDEFHVHASMHYYEGKLAVRDAQGSSIEIFDLNGRSVYLSEITSPLTEISLSFLNQGHYFAVLKNGATALSKRFIIQ